MPVFTSEFLGTAILVMLGNALVSSLLLGRSRGENAGWLALSIGWGAALFAGVWVAASSGAHLNPAITIGLATAGAIPASTLATHIPAQLLGAGVGALASTLAFLPHWRATNSPERILSCYCTVPAIHAPLSNLLSQALGMFVLVVFVHAAVDKPWTPPVTSVIDAQGAVVVSDAWRVTWWQFAGSLGLILAAIMLSFGGAIGGAMNPARDISSRLVHAMLPIPGKATSEWNHAWVPVIGPIIGAVAGLIVVKAAGWR